MAHLEDVGLALTVDAGEGSIDGSLNAPHFLDELGIPRSDTFLIQFIEIFTWVGKKREII